MYVLCASITVAGEDMEQPAVIGRLGVLSISGRDWVGLVSDFGSLVLLVVGDSAVLWPLGSSFVEKKKRVIELVINVLIGAGGLFFRGALTALVVTFQVFLLEAFHVVTVLPGMVGWPTGLAVSRTWSLHDLLVCSVVMGSLVTVSWAPFVPVIIGENLLASTGLRLRSCV